MNKLKQANPHFTICTCVLIVSVQVVYVFQWNLYFGSVNIFFLLDIYIPIGAYIVCYSCIFISNANNNWRCQV